MNQLRKKPFWQGKVWFLLAAFILLMGWASRQTIVQDLWRGMGYRPDEKMQEIEEALELTGRSRQIFAASWPVIESSADFNEHCNSHDRDISLLGCYTGGRIYIYEIELEELKSGNIVTTAHELLHAVWERMSDGEQKKIKEWLMQLYEERREWFDEELEVYAEDEWIEEMYVRAGTKLADLPEEAEEHFRKFFQNRAKVVEYYKLYEAPFSELKTKMEELMVTVEKVRAEIIAERENYLTEVKDLESRIDAFNQCAGTVGCFRSETEFSTRRQALMATKNELESKREQLNSKIEENNERIEQYRELQAGLGKLSDAVNSNVELIEETKSN